MVLPIGKVAPTAVVAAMVTYWCWPHLVDGPAAEQPRAKLPALDTALVSPPKSAAPERDPFLTGPQPANAAGANEPPPTVHSQPTEQHAYDPAQSEQWVLNATMLRGERRIAVINGKLYGEGEPIATPDPTAHPYVVSEIDSDQVVIRRSADTVDLRYAVWASPELQKSADTLGNGSQSRTKRTGARPPNQKSSSKHSHVTP
jgi:hypothetical protein